MKFCVNLFGSNLIVILLIGNGLIIMGLVVSFESDVCEKNFGCK